jgi:hypothetical protein
MAALASWALAATSGAAFGGLEAGGVGFSPPHALSTITNKATLPSRPLPILMFILILCYQVAYIQYT